MSQKPDVQELAVPKTRTETLRQRGGGSSGLPPTSKTALGLEGSRNPPAGQVLNAFGIDFGEEYSRIASLRNGVPFFVPPGVFQSVIEIELPNQVNDSRRLVISGLRSNLRSQVNSATSNPDVDDLVKTLFGRVRSYINSMANIPRPKVVLTVPAYYCSEERIQVVRCAELAGLEVIGLINDYAAVVHSFVNGRAARSGTILVLSIGAETVSTAVVKVVGALIETVASMSAPGFGGRYVIDYLASHLLHKSESVKSFDELPAEQSEEWRDYAKDLLLNYGQNNESISVLGVDHAYVISVPKPELLDVLAFSLSDAVRLASDVLKESGVSREKLDFVLIVGGIVSNPIVSRHVAQQFPRLHRMILSSDRAPAFGAALRAGVLENHLEEPLLWDVLTQSIYKSGTASKQTIVPVGISLPTTMNISITDPDSEITQQRSGSEDLPSGHLAKISSGCDSSRPVTVELSINRDGILDLCEHIEPEETVVANSML